MNVNTGRTVRRIFLYFWYTDEINVDKHLEKLNSYKNVTITTAGFKAKLAVKLLFLKII